MFIFCGNASFYKLTQKWWAYFEKGVDSVGLLVLSLMMSEALLWHHSGALCRPDDLLQMLVWSWRGANHKFISRVSVSVPSSLTPRPRQARLRCLCQLTLWSLSVLTQGPHTHPSTVTHPLHPCLSIRGWVHHLHSVSRPHVVTRCPRTLFFSGFRLHVGPDHISFKRAKITEMRSRS